MGGLEVPVAALPVVVGGVAGGLEERNPSR